MTELIAKPVVKNKFWIVESLGKKLATIQAVDDGTGFVYVDDTHRELFPSIKLLSKQYNISFAKVEKTKPPIVSDHTVYGYPCSGKPHNEVLDVQRHLPIYAKNFKSKSLHCAGYYVVKLGVAWSVQFCPKLITLNRYEYQGPFKLKERAESALGEINGQ